MEKLVVFLEVFSDFKSFIKSVWSGHMSRYGNFFCKAQEKIFTHVQLFNLVNMFRFFLRMPDKRL